MIAIVQLKWRMADIRIVSIAASTIYHWQKFCPFILFVVEKSSKICLYNNFFPFCLTIYLNIEGCWESLPNAKKRT